MIKNEPRAGEPVIVNGTIHWRLEGNTMFCGLETSNQRHEGDIELLPHCNECLTLHDGDGLI